MTTKTAQFTPGPWVVTEHSAGMICVAGPNNKDLCAVGYNRTEGRNDVANANLIAAAPAMYEALKDLIGDLGDLHGGSIAELQCHWCGRDYEDEEAGGLCTSDDCPGYIARQAIAQAEGRQA